MKKILLLLIIPFLSVSQQLNTETIFYDGHNREYIIYVPQSYSSSTTTPILFAFHGGSGYAYDFMNYEADFRPIADTANFILVYPQALEDPNDGNSTNWLHKDPTDHKDIFFIEYLIDTLSTQFNIDDSRVYATGYSLGGMFSYELACQLNEKITAIASVAGAAFHGAFSYCDITHPTAVLSINGTDDGTHPYIDINDWGYFSIPEIDSFWVHTNNTDIFPVVNQLPDINSNDGSTVERYTWNNGDGCVTVEELKIINGGHDWPSSSNSSGNQDIDANIEVWNFVSKFDMDGLIGCNSTSSDNSIISSSKEIVRIVNILGVNSIETNYSPLFYIYDDGTVEKKIIID